MLKNLSNHSLGCLERWKFPCMIIEGLQYGFGELYWWIIFKPFKELNINNTLFYWTTVTIKLKLFFSVLYSEFSHKISNVFSFMCFK